MADLFKITTSAVKSGRINETFGAPLRDSVFTCRAVVLTKTAAEDVTTSPTSAQPSAASGSPSGRGLRGMKELGQKAFSSLSSRTMGQRRR